MMQLWERNDASPPVGSAPGRRERKHPYVVLCHRRPQEHLEQVVAAGFDEPSPSEHESTTIRTAVVYQWVRLAR
jgi:hypothetical protein